MTSDAPRFPWPPGSASGAGSMPGTDPLAAVRAVLDELPDLPYLPELPARGPGADLIGRTAALLTELPVETTPAGWRLAARPGRDQRRARALLDQDLDTLEEAAAGYRGPLKIQACGPLTLAASLELPSSLEVALADPGAVADLTQSLAEGIRAHAGEVRKRVPGATLLLQCDEPRLPAVLDGAIPTASGLRRVAAVEPGPAADSLRAVLAASGAYRVVHCCAARPPLRAHQPGRRASGLPGHQPAPAGGRRSAGGGGGGRQRHFRGRRSALGFRTARGQPAGEAGHRPVAPARPAAGRLRGAGGDRAGLRAGRRVARAGRRGARRLPGGRPDTARDDRGGHRVTEPGRPDHDPALPA